MESEITFPSPTGKPLGTNRTFQICVKIVLPILRLVSKRDWSGQANIPKSGPAVVVSNHMSYVDVFFFAEFLYFSGRAPRFIGKRSVFRAPIIGRIVTAAGQIPVDRETSGAAKALEHALAALRAGHLIGIYPEGTLTRDKDLWPMVAKTGAARLAITLKCPIIPVVAWGPQKVLPQYSKRPHIWPRTKMTLRAGKPIDMSKWYGREEDQSALIEATAHIMATLTSMLEEIRGECAPPTPFDPHTSELPRIGNFRKVEKKRAGK